MRWRVTTPRGVVDARDVLVATNAYADSLVPSLRRRVLPMGSFIIATEPLAPDLAEAVLPTGRMCFNDRNLLWYWRLDDEGRMVFGGRKRLGQVQPRGGPRPPLPVDARGPPAARRYAGRAGVGWPGRAHPRPAPPLRPHRRALVRHRLQRLRRRAQHLARSPHGGAPSTASRFPPFAELRAPPDPAALAAAGVAAGGVSLVPLPRQESMHEDPRGRQRRRGLGLRHDRPAPDVLRAGGAGRPRRGARRAPRPRRPAILASSARRSTPPTAPRSPSAPRPTAPRTCSTPPTPASSCRSSAAPSTPARPTSTWPCRSRTRTPSDRTRSPA